MNGVSLFVLYSDTMIYILGHIPALVWHQSIKNDKKNDKLNSSTSHGYLTADHSH